MAGKRILIIASKIQTTLELSRALNHPLGGGHQVETCPLTNVALTRLRHVPFDLIVTDLHMPGMDGLELIHYVRRASPQTRIMLIPTHGSPQMESQTRRLGAAYLPKPFSLPEFVVAVQHILNEDVGVR